VAVAIGVGTGAHAEVEFPFLQVGPGDFAVGVEVARDGCAQQSDVVDERLPAGELAEVSAEPHVADRRSRGDDDGRRVGMPLAGGVIGGVDKLDRLAGERAARVLRSGEETRIRAKAAAGGNVEELEVEAELKL